MLDKIQFGLRVFTLILAAVVIGLSVTLAKHQRYGAVPGQTGYGTFSGGFGMVASLVGLAAAFVTAIPSFFVMVVDAAATVVYLTAGIVLAITMKGITCTPDDGDTKAYSALQGSSILNGGTKGCGDGDVCYGIRLDLPDNAGAIDALHEFQRRCVRAQSDYSVMLVAAAFSVAVLVVSVLRRRKEKHSAV